VYSGETGNGPAGVGWHLSEIAIRRSLREGVPTYTEADELELVGMGAIQTLVPAPGAPAGTYLVEGHPTTMKVVKKEGGFEVTDADGTRYQFGYSAEAREQSGDKVSAWLVQWIVHFGQTIEFRYERNNAKAYLSRVLWGPGQRFRATLTYQDRPDSTISFRTGYQVITARRLEKATVSVGSAQEKLREYTVTYDDSFGLSRLTKVVQTGTGTAAWPAATFEYAAAGPAQTTKVAGLEGWVLNARGTSLSDVDGDGMADLLRLEMGNHVYRKNVGGTFASERPLKGAGHIELDAAQLMDLDGDARAELVHVVDDTWRPYKLTGEQWSPMEPWNGTRLVPLQSRNSVLADVDGDGRTDVLEAGTGGLSVRLAANGRLEPRSFRGRIDPDNIVVEPGNDDVKWVDVNDDGLVDAVWLTDEWFKIYLGRGDGTFLIYKRAFYPWKSVSNAQTVFASSDIHLADLNGDGLLDMVVINAANVLYFRGLPTLGSFDTLRHLDRPEGVAYDAVVTITDANGNGSRDVVWSSPRGMWILDLAGGTTAGMLSEVRNGLGATTTIAYTYSALLSVEAENAGHPWEVKLPVSVPVPTRQSVDSGGDSPTRVTMYTVRDGFWDGVERRFGGFLGSHSAVSGQSAGQMLVEDTRYHAGAGADRVLRGLVWHHQTSNGLGRIFKTEKTDWLACRVAHDDPLLRRAATTASYTFLEDGAAPIETKSTFELDSSCRPVVERHLGMPGAGDERTVRREYDDDDTTWIRDRVCHETVLEGDDLTVRSETLTSYGSAGSTQYQPCSGQLGNGWVKQVDVRLRYGMADEGTVTARTASYDSFGNPTQIAEAGVTRTIGYDTDKLHPITESIAGTTLGWAMTWDPVLGLPSTLTDPNGDITSVSYDDLARPSGVSLNGAAPHRTYSYDWETLPPRTTTSSFDHAPPSTCTPASRQTTTVSNGLGEPLFSSTPLSVGRWIISGWKERNERGEVVLAAEPFYSATSSPSVRAPGTRSQTFEHDALGRLTVQLLPNGARKTVLYTGNCQTVSSDELAPVTSCADGLGRTVRTERVVSAGPRGGGGPESVDAQYDAADRIVSMKLQRGMPNETEHRFSYDTWGRLREAHDPDTGLRLLGYYPSGLLRQHTNGEGQDVYFDYDSAGRLIRRGPLQTPDPMTDYVYTYDDPAAGLESGCRVVSRLASVVEQAAGQVKFCYDSFGRQNGMARTIVAPGGSRTASSRSTFSPSGLLVSEQYDDGFATNYCYDGAGRATQITSSGTVLWSATGPDDLDASGRVVNEQYGNGASETYTYDSLGLARNVGLRSTVSGQVVDLFKIEVTARTAFGAPLAVEDRDANSNSLDHSATFTYDTGARLTQSTLGRSDDVPNRYTFSFAYDTLQNMIVREVSLGTTPKDIGVLTGQYKYRERGYGPRQLTSVVP
jgi:YD repeat-containing protein